MSDRKPKILVVGSFMMDLIASAPRVPDLGETVIGTSFETAGGGKGINQAVQCARLGADVTMAGCVGDDAFGREMLELASSSGVDVSHVKISTDHSSGVGNIQLQVREDEVQNRIMVIPGANYDLTVDDLDWLSEEIKRYDIVLMQLELKMDVIEHTARLARLHNVPVMLNPAPAAELSDELLSNVTYLSPNEFEAALLSDSSMIAVYDETDDQSLIRIADSIRARGTSNLIITLGSKGSVFINEQGITHIDPVSMDDVKDPTAAGDSFIGAFCYGLTSGLTEEQAMVFASHTAAITVTRMGAMPSLPDIDEVVSLMRDRDCSLADDVRLKD